MAIAMHAAALPATFDPRTTSPQCFEILNQGQCGSCFVHSAASVMSTRMCLLYSGDGMQSSRAQNPLDQVGFNQQSSAAVPSLGLQQVSTQYIIDCMAGGNAAYASSTYIPDLSVANGGVCQQGGFPSDALMFLALTTPAGNTLATSLITGTTVGTFWPTCTNGCTQGCRPYESGQCSVSVPTATSGVLTNACPSQTCPLTGALYCVSSTIAAPPAVTQTGFGWTVSTAPWPVNAFSGATVAEIQAEIQANGPVSTAIRYCSNTGLSDYGWNACVVNGAVAPYTEAETCATTFAHSVTLVGWTVLGTQTVWIVQNSWGTAWGVSGFFYLSLGSNTFGVESNVVAPQLQLTPPGSTPISSYQMQYGTEANNEDYMATLPSVLPRPGASSVGYSKGQATSDATRALALLALNTFAAQKGLRVPFTDTEHPTVWMQTTAVGVVMRAEGPFVDEGGGGEEYHVVWMLRRPGNSSIAVASSQRMTAAQIALHKQGWSVLRSPPKKEGQEEGAAWTIPTVVLLCVAIVALVVALVITNRRRLRRERSIDGAA